MCRYSDAALIQFDAGVTNNLGYLAKTVEDGFGGLAIVGSRTIPVDGSSAMQGASIAKVGRTTGYSSGVVTAHCVDVPQFEAVNGVAVDTNRDMRCQDQADYYAEPGDSGSPVFSLTNDGWLLGLHWGTSFSIRGDPTSPQRTTYSPWGNTATEVTRDLGAGYQATAALP